MQLTDEVSQAQFQPLDTPGATSGLQLAPLVPSAAAEASTGTSAGPSVTSGEPVAPGSIVAESDANMSQSVPMESLTDESYLGMPMEEAFIEQNSAVTFSTGNWFRRGMWYSQQDLTLLIRSEFDKTVISADNSATSGSGGVGTTTLEPSYVPGTRLTIGRFLGQDVVNRDHMVEFVFFGLFDYSSSASIVSSTTDSIQTTLGQGTHWFTNDESGGINGPPAPGFGDAQRHDLLYDSDLNNYELNFRLLGRPLRDHLSLQPNGSWVRHGASSQLKSLLLGMRAVSINELFRLDASFSNPVVSGSHEVKTSNDMFGIQTGVEVIENYSSWSWGFRGKLGGLFNFSDRRLRTLTIDGDDRELVSQNLTKENLAILMEGGLVSSYQIRPNLTVRAGYDVIYINGVATAPQNAGLQPGFPPYEVTGDALYHGMSVGLEMLW